MGPLQDIRETWARFLNDENAAWVFIRRRRLTILAISVAVLIPCFWHRRIEAGDLASHVYNAWLAQLIEKGQAQGLYIARQWNNVLFDVSLLHVANVAGFAAAERIVVSAFVLIFFWGVFALIAVVTERPPWLLTPCIAMLAYGYSFNMGFVNYYVSLGLACFGLAILWKGKGIAWLGGAICAALALVAHPIGFLWFVGTVAYIRLRETLPRRWKLVLPLSAVAAFFAAAWYFARHSELRANWDRGPFYFYNGADQLALYGSRYVIVAVAAFWFGTVCVAWELFGKREALTRKQLWLPLELYTVTFCAVALLPENFHPTFYGGWIGLIGSRLTSVSAILGLCILGLLRPRRWHIVGFGGCCVVFFAFLYQDTGWINQLEANAERLGHNLASGTRVIVTIDAQPDSRIQFIGHAAERACIGHCFSYANYEPSSAQFRVRVRESSPLVTSSSDEAEDMASGDYEVEDSDLPLKQMYQCDANDLRKLCIRDLVAGETNGRFSYKPADP